MLTRDLTSRAWGVGKLLLDDISQLKRDGVHQLVMATLVKLDKAEVLKTQKKFESKPDHLTIFKANHEES